MALVVKNLASAGDTRELDSWLEDPLEWEGLLALVVIDLGSLCEIYYKGDDQRT